FPAKYLEVARESSRSQTRLMNVTEYLAQLFTMGVKAGDLPAIQPILQHRIWDRLGSRRGPESLEQTIGELRREDSGFEMAGGSWTNDISWVKGYDALLGPMERVSALFFEKALASGVSTAERRFRNALFHLLASQTSCYRYWGQGLWVQYGLEICRRATEILTHDF